MLQIRMHLLVKDLLNLSRVSLVSCLVRCKNTKLQEILNFLVKCGQSTSYQSGPKSVTSDAAILFSSRKSEIESFSKHISRYPLLTFRVVIFLCCSIKKLYILDKFKEDSKMPAKLPAFFDVYISSVKGLVSGKKCDMRLNLLQNVIGKNLSPSNISIKLSSSVVM